MNEKPWTSQDSLRLHETIGELKLRHNKWAYFELARLLPVFIDHVVVATALEGAMPIALSEATALRTMMDKVLAVPPTRGDK